MDRRSFPFHLRMRVVALRAETNCRHGAPAGCDAEGEQAVASVFDLSNMVLLAMEKERTVEGVQAGCQAALDQCERTLCEGADVTADLVFDLMPPGELVFSYS